MMKHLRPADYRSMPWKNGSGTTIEMAVWPALAGLDDFVWRVSRAQVVVDGGFSHFAGIDRSLALLQGAGMHLRGGGTTLTLDQYHHHIAVFAGDTGIAAELIDGPISDLNVMSRRSHCHHRLTYWSGATTHRLPINTTLIFCAQGSMLFDCGMTTATVLAGESLVFTPDEPVTDYVVRCSHDSQSYCIQIHLQEP